MKVSAAILKKKTIDIFKKYKLTSKQAKISADIIIKAELVGASSHGLSRLISRNVAISFKGTGFYINDSTSSATSKSSAATSS